MLKLEQAIVVITRVCEAWNTRCNERCVTGTPSCLLGIHQLAMLSRPTVRSIAIRWRASGLERRSSTCTCCSPTTVNSFLSTSSSSTLKHIRCRFILSRQCTVPWTGLTRGRWQWFLMALCYVLNTVLFMTDDALHSVQRVKWVRSRG